MSSSLIELATELQRTRLRMHASSTSLSLVASALVLLAMALLVHQSVPSGLWLTWAICVLATWVLRAAVWRVHRRQTALWAASREHGLVKGTAAAGQTAGQETANEADTAADKLIAVEGDPALTARWLLWHRLGFALEGLAWALGSVWLASLLSAQQLNLWVLCLAALCVGRLILVSFDAVAALMFAVPVLAAPGLHLLVNSDAELTLSATLLLVLSLGGLGVLGSQRLLKSGVKQRLLQQRRVAEAERHASAAEANRQALAEQHHLLAQLMQTSSQGFWFIDAQGQTTDVNAAMCELLGRPRNLVVDRHVLEFFEGEDIDLLQHELRKRAEGARGGYEIGIRRPDGTRRHCLNQATPIYDLGGRRVGSIGLWTDLSARRQIEQDLLTYKLVANSITDLVSVLGEDHVYRMVNNAWCQATGLARERVIGRHAQDVLPEAADAERSRALRECIELRQSRSVRALTQIKGLAGRMLETTYYPYGDEAAGVRCVVMVSRDVSAEAQALQGLQAAELELRALLEAFPGYIGALDQELRYTYVNARLQPLLGRPGQALIGQSLRDVLPISLQLMIEEELQRAARGETVVSRRDYIDPDTGMPLILELTHVAGPLRADGRRSYYGFGLDVTARVQAESELRSARDEAEAANRAKTEFLSHMSHELRTPLNAILGFGQLLQTDPAQALSEQQLLWVRELLRGANHLLELINEVLDLGRIEAGQLRIDSAAVPLAALIEECLALVQPLAAAQGVRMLPMAPVALQVQADRMRLKQVLLNLLGNAIQYNHPGGEVELSCRADGEQVLLTVRDTGPGLSTEQQAQLFQPFVRLHARQSAAEGTGIGLALSRELMAAMAGTIGVHSTPGEGSRFWIRLPAPAPGPALPRATELQTGQREVVEADPIADDATARLQTVLYIEDNPVNLSLMAAMLARLEGVRLVTAESPLPGLELARELNPALVLLDIHLPDIDGFEVLRRLRGDPLTQLIPVIAVSANALRSDIDAAMAAGFDDYLTKPLRLQLLLDTVRKMLQT